MIETLLGVVFALGIVVLSLFRAWLEARDGEVSQRKRADQAAKSIYDANENFDAIMACNRRRRDKDE